MLRQIIRPTAGHYDLHIPQEYINQEIEIMILPLFALKQSNTTQLVKKEFNPKEFYAATVSSKTEIDEYLLSNKNDWE